MLRVLLVIAALLVACAVAYRDAPEVNSRPIIGILTQPTGKSISKYGKSYIAASYVKFFEGAGARVVPIMHTSTQEELKAIFSQINGVFFPGGGSDINNSQLYKSAQYLFNLAIAANDKGDYFPVMGHCMGFEILSIITSKNFTLLEPFDAENIALPLKLDQNAYSSRYFARAGADLLHIYQSQNVTMNNHVWGVSPPEYKANSAFGSFWNILSTNADRKGRTFVSTVEAVNYPIYALQWHAEKALYEWDPKEVIPHSDAATLANQYIAEFYVSEARKSTHKFKSAQAEYKSLIYNYSPVYTADVISFVQCYVW